MIVCITAIVTVIGLILISELLPHVKAENNIVSGNSSLLVNEGIALGLLGNSTAAIKYFDKALAIKPHNVFALANKGLALGRLGNSTAAIKYFDKALTIDPDDVAALTGKGVALDELGNHTEAIQYFDKALVIDPHNLAALYNKGVALDKIKKSSQLAPTTSNQSTTTPAPTAAPTTSNQSTTNAGTETYNERVLINTGWALYSLGNYAQSIPYFVEAFATDPNNKYALTYEGAALNHLGNCAASIHG
jgi:tetratricopeptide (TPR) repeat protein